MRRAVIILLLCCAGWALALPARGAGPMVDRYGQARAWEGPRVTKDAELRADLSAEDKLLRQMPASKDYDKYGGYLQAGWKEKGSGFFRVQKKHGYWWLISPLGNPCFYLGVDTFPGQVWESTPVTGRESLFQGLPARQDKLLAPAWTRGEWGAKDEAEYYSHYAANLIRKYGKKNWKQEAERRGLRRLKAWGFHGAGKWSEPGKFVHAPVLTLGSFSLDKGMPDFNNPFFRAQIIGALKAQVEPHKGDPWILGWSVGNELSMLVTKEHVKQVLAMPGEAPAKVSLIDYAVVTMYDGNLERLEKVWKVDVVNRLGLYDLNPAPPEEDMERMRRFLADKFYSLVFGTIREADPNHLILGSWVIPDASARDWDLFAKYCDVIGYDHYANSYGDGSLLRLQQQTDKPTLCGEFSFPPSYDGERGFGRLPISPKNDAEAGEQYSRWVQAAAKDPHCVGLMWYQYRDQPITGRGPGKGKDSVYGDNYATGLVTITDRPKWELVKRVREANLQAAKWRVAASRK